MTDASNPPKSSALSNHSRFELLNLGSNSETTGKISHPSATRSASAAAGVFAFFEEEKVSSNENASWRVSSNEHASSFSRRVFVSARRFGRQLEAEPLVRDERVAVPAVRARAVRSGAAVLGFPAVRQDIAVQAVLLLERAARAATEAGVHHAPDHDGVADSELGDVASNLRDDAGELVANLSASDLRRLDRESFRLLALPVAEFISRRKGDAIGRRDAPFAEARRLDELDMNDAEEGAAVLADAAARAREDDIFAQAPGARLENAESSRVFRSPRSLGVDTLDRTFVELVFARKSTSLRKALSLFVRHGIHHVYVVDDDDKPVAVLTPTDILRLFAVEDDDAKWHNAWYGDGHRVVA